MAERSSRQKEAGALERGLADLAAAERQAARRRGAETARAVHEERLRRLEQDLGELRGRVNGLIFLVVGTVVTQVIVRLLG
jgi:hypothetical protein